MTRILAALAPLTLFATPIAAQDDSLPEAEIYATQLVVIETTMGDITVEIETERAPVTAANFLRYVDEDRFDGTTFYRAMHLDWGEPPNGLLQGGTQMHPTACSTRSRMNRQPRPALATPMARCRWRVTIRAARRVISRS